MCGWKTKKEIFNRYRNKQFVRNYIQEEVMPKKIIKADRNDYINICVSLMQMKFDLMKLGLYKTSHKLEEAIKEVGWEAAEKLGKKKGK